MKKLFALLSLAMVFVLSGCFEEEEEPKTMQDVNIEDSVEIRMEVIMHYEGPFIDETFYEIGYYDFEEEWSYYEKTDYYMNGDSFKFFFETVDGNTYMYEFEDVDYDRMMTASRFRIDDIYSEDDFNFIDAFSSEFDEEDYEMLEGLMYYYKQVPVSDLGEGLQGYIQSLSYHPVLDKTVEVIMYCHPTSEYCDYRLGLDEIAEDTVTGDFDDLDLTIDIVHTFYTEDTLQKENVLPQEFISDDYPNTLDSLMFSGNRIHAPVFQGYNDYEYDGDMFQFQVSVSGNYHMKFYTNHLREESLYILLVDDMFNFLFEDEVYNQTSMPVFELEEGVTYYILIAAYDGTITDFDFDIRLEIEE